MLFILFGFALSILAILAIVGNISNSRAFGNKIMTPKLSWYITALVVGLLMLVYAFFF